MKLLAFTCMILTGSFGCGPEVQTICRSDIPVEQIRVSAIMLQSSVRTVPTIDQLRYGGYNEVITDEDSVQAICVKLTELKPIAYPHKNFSLRAICEIEYANDSIDVIQIDSDGRLKYKDVVLEDSYSFLTLLGIVCLRTD